MDIFAIRLNSLIEESKITKYKLSKELHCSKQTVCNWCDGYNEPTVSYIRAIANYFSVSSDYLLGLEDETGSKSYEIYFEEYERKTTLKEKK